MPIETDPKSSVPLSVLRDLVTAGLEAKKVPGFQPSIVLAKDQTLQPLPEAELPDHVRQNVSLQELASFIAYVKAFAEASTRIFVSTTDQGANFVAVMDYHDGEPKWTEHRATFSPSYSPEFAAWLAINRQPKSQEDFLDHLRRWSFSAISHASADIEEFISTLEFKTDGQYSSKLQPVTSGRALVWTENVTGGGNVRGEPVPIIERLTLSIPLFAGGEVFAVDVALRYKVSNGTLRITTELVREHLIIRQAVTNMVTQVATETGHQPFLGKLG